MINPDSLSSLSVSCQPSICLHLRSLPQAPITIISCEGEWADSWCATEGSWTNPNPGQCQQPNKGLKISNSSDEYSESPSTAPQTLTESMEQAIQESTPAEDRPQRKIYNLYRRIYLKYWPLSSQRVRQRRERRAEDIRLRPQKFHMGNYVEGTGPLFTLLPPELRLYILVHAFGGQTIHLDLEAKLNVMWKWSNCICHGDKQGLVHPAVRPDFKVELKTRVKTDPRNCPRLATQGKSHYGRCPRDCSAGAKGWLLTCRQG